MAKHKSTAATVEDMSEALGEPGGNTRSLLADAGKLKGYREIVQRPGDVLRKPNIREMLADAGAGVGVKDPNLTPE